MAQKDTYDVDIDGARSDYRAVSDIPTARLTNGATIRIWPGTYTNIAVDGTNLAYEGVGDIDEVVIDGGFTLTNASTSTFSVKNMTIKGNNPSSVGGAAAVTQLATDGAVNIKLTEVKASNAELVVQHHGTGTITLDRVDGSGVDKGVLSNSTATPGVLVTYSRLGANAYVNSGGGTDVGVSVLASSGGANTGATTQTVIALIA